MVRRVKFRVRLWGLVNCAEWAGPLETPTEVDAEIFDKTIAINTRAAILVVKYAARTIVRLGNGEAIVNISS